MKFLKLLSLTIVVVILQGCFENRSNTDQLCQKKPELKCDELNINDGQCRVTRTDLIWHRLTVLKNPSADNKIKEYHLTQKYKQCLEVASQIIPINRPKLKQARFNALMNAGNNMKRIVDELHTIDSPEALYFLWSQTGDKTARRKFLQKEGQPELNTEKLQYALATFYIDRNRPKTIKLLNHSLELSTPDTIQLEAIESLAGLYEQAKNKEASYIWAMVGKHFGAAVASTRDLKLLYDFNDEKIERLNKVIDQVVEALENGTYQRTLIPQKFES